MLKYLIVKKFFKFKFNMEEITKLRAEKDEIQKILVECQNQNSNSVNNLEKLKLEIQLKEARLTEVKNELVLNKDQLKKYFIYFYFFFIFYYFFIRNKDELDYTIKELNRLREHLLSMEDISTKEAIMAEERETQLRNEIRNLQNKTQVFYESANQFQNQYQVFIFFLW